jgi:hypothetical protein
LTLQSGWRMVLRKEKSKSQIPEKDDRANAFTATTGWLASIRTRQGALNGGAG